MGDVGLLSIHLPEPEQCPNANTPDFCSKAQNLKPKIKNNKDPWKFLKYPGQGDVWTTVSLLTWNSLKLHTYGLLLTHPTNTEWIMGKDITNRYNWDDNILSILLSECPERRSGRCHRWSTHFKPLSPVYCESVLFSPFYLCHFPFLLAQTLLLWASLPLQTLSNLVSFSSLLCATSSSLFIMHSNLRAYSWTLSLLRQLHCVG